LFPSADKISAQEIKSTIGVAMEGCYSCPVRCKKVVSFDDPYQVDSAYGGPEYETLAAFGSNCGVDDLRAIAKASELCNANSIDIISTGCSIAFAMECFENGLLRKEDTDGIELRFGNADAILRVIPLIVRREGIGDLLADGSARAAERIGSHAKSLAMEVKKLEIPMHEPRLNPGLALGYMVNPHGADHVCNMIDFVQYRTSEQVKELNPLGILEPVPLDDVGPRKVALFRAVQLKKILQDSLVICMYLPYSYEQIAGIVAAVTGWDIDVGELVKTGERILTTTRLFNTREGLTSADDRLPERFFRPTTDGALADKALDAAAMHKARSCYYSLMGWDATTGIPLPEKVDELTIR
jgi:aldehyde:ferredoxin oxidoreductase